MVQPSDFPECCVVGQTVGNDVQWFCSEVLIHPRAVLTATHCVQDRPDRVLLNADSTSFSSYPELVPVTRMRVHPDYVPGATHDLCILILGRPSGVAPVAIATSEEVGAANNVLLVGFGYSDPSLPIGFWDQAAGGCGDWAAAAVARR